MARAEMRSARIKAGFSHNHIAEIIKSLADPFRPPMSPQCDIADVRSDARALFDHSIAAN